MTESGPHIGDIFWQDLTVHNADEVRDFYRDVAGWEFRSEDMGGYEDYHMLAPGTEGSVAGICHARGPNAGVPPQWLVYILVADVDQSVQRCVERGGEVVDGPRDTGSGRFCVIRDPAGAVCAVYAHAGRNPQEA